VEWAGGTASIKRGTISLSDAKLYCHLVGSLCRSLTRPRWFYQSLPNSVPQPKSALLGGRLHLGVLLALFIVDCSHVLLWRTPPLGFVYGLWISSAHCRPCYQINLQPTFLIALMLSGGLAGVAGIIETGSYNIHTRLKEGISPGYRLALIF